MNDRAKTNTELIEEITALKEKIQELEHSEAERKRAEEALRESEERYHRITEAITDYIYTVRVVDGRAVETTHGPGCLAVTGYQANEFANDPFLWFRMVVTEDRPEVEEQARRILAGKDPPPIEHRIVHKKGMVLWVRNTFVPHRDEHGALVAYDGLIQNISERKLAEAQRAEMESQNLQLQKAESLGRMAGAIAHHFNNQLGVVIGNLEMAIGELPQGAGPVNSLTAAMQAAGKAAEMSGLMLTYIGQSFDKREPLDLSDACRRILPMLQAIMPGDVVLETDLPSPGPTISTTSDYIQQILTNLVTNAWEAVGEGRGAIHLSVRTVFAVNIPAVHRFPLDWKPQDNAYACLEVTDAGGGIADKDIEKLFDPFFTSKFTGRGMGLAVVLGIVRAHSGVVTVESEPGRSSTFRVFFPVSGEEVLRQPDKGNRGDTLLQGVPTIPSPIEMEGDGTILLVEDEEMLRSMAAAMLKCLGFSVLEAKDGIEAVAVFQQRQDEIRCVLCDLTMPRMNGWETLTALRKLEPDIPVILSSGYDKAQVMSGDHPEWPQVFLGKPYKLKELRDGIWEALVSTKK